MKRFFGIALLLLSVAASGFEATTYHYVAQTATVRTSGTVTAAGITWNCTGNRCSTAGPWPTPSVAACHALAKQVGVIRAYGHQKKMLSPAELQQCNAGVTNLTAVAVPSPGQLPALGRMRAAGKAADAAKPPIRVTQIELKCPVTPAVKSKARVVRFPIDEKKGDCALVGKGVEIENYLRSLETLAAECKARIGESWSGVQEAKAKLDTEIDALPGETPPRIEAPPLCGVISPSEPGEPLEGGFEGNQYTNWLKRIGKDTVKFCRLVDELVKPLKKSCDEMNEEIRCLIESHQGVSDATKTAMHRRLAGSMNAATRNHDYLDFFYNNTLSVFGWGNFRKYFNESTLKCLTQEPKRRKGR